MFLASQDVFYAGLGSMAAGHGLADERASRGRVSSQSGIKCWEVFGNAQMQNTPTKLKANESHTAPINDPVCVQIKPP
ncbi:MAG: hypothetical protein MK125_06740, partial [Dehalococcoidia bacterium]|nr:hypothetical protein [Dehalococcoidia bacterium]